MQPRKVNDINELLTINGPNGPIGGGYNFGANPILANPKPVQIRDFGPQISADDLYAQLGQQLKVDPASISRQINPKVNISLDPTSRRIKIEAPQYYVDSKEFKEQVLPVFQQLEGKEFTDTQFKQIVNSDMLKDIQTQADDVRKRFEAILEYKNQFPKASEDDAMIYFRNAAAAKASDSDENTQLVVGRNEDGSLITSSIKEYLDGFKGLDDSIKGKKLKTTLESLESSDKNETDKAIELGLLRFLKEKGALEASGLTKWDLGMQKFLAEGDKSVPGWIYNQTIGRISSGLDQTQAEQYREKLANDPRTALEGVEPALTIGGAVGTGAGIVADVAISGPFAELALAKGGAAASRIPGAANALKSLDTGLDAVRASGTAGKITAGTIESIPRDISFGVQRALVEDNYNAPADFAINTAINAATLGGAKLGGRVLRSVDTATNGALKNASEIVGRAGVRGYDAVRELPGINKAMDFISGGFVDQAAPLRRAARSAWGTGKITTDEYYTVSNAIRSAIQRGRGEAANVMRYTPEFRQAYEAGEAIRKIGPEQIDKAAQYVNAVQELQYAKAGRYKVTQKKMKELEGIVAANQSPEFDAYRQALANWNAKITDFAVANGIMDEDLVRIMRDDPAFAAGYVRLQKNLPGIEDNVPRFESASRNLKNKEVVKKLKGPAAIEDLNDPFAVATDRLNAIAELASMNRVNRLVVGGINNGWIEGRVLQSAQDLRTRNALRQGFKEEREIVDNLVDTQVSKLEADLNKLVDDVEDFNGSGRVAVAQRIEKAVDEMVDAIVKDPKLDAEVTRLMDELGGGKEGAERVAALGVLNRNKQRVTERLEKSLQSTELGREERTEVVRLFDNAINDELDVELASRGTNRGPLRSNFDELKKLNQEIVPNAELKGPGVQAYYENGQKGYYELADPELQRYFNMAKSPAEDNWFQKLLMNTSRAFKLTTTGINPAFVPVNLTRDIPQATAVSGVNVLSPSISHKSLLESLGVGADEAERLSREFDAFIGQSTQFDISRQAENTFQTTYNIGRELERGKAKNIVYNLANPKQSIRQLEDLFGEVETATRKRVYQARFDSAIQRGADVGQAQNEALFYAAQATADFLNVGSRVQSFVRTVPYLTAAINGKASFARLWMLDPIGVTARIASGFVAPAMWLTIHNLTDPEKAAEYFSIPQWERQNNMIVVLDNNSHVSIPLGQELAAIIAPFRERIEAHYGLEHNNFMETMGKFVLSQSPVDLSPLMTRDFQGNLDPARSSLQIASGVVPQLFRSPLEMLAGRDLYTGAAINPSDEELIARGQVQPGEEITNADRTYEGRDSMILGNIANAIGVPQGTLQNVMKNYGGAVGAMVLNQLDKMAGAPPEKQGGKGLQDALAARFFGGSFDQVQSDFYNGLDKLEAEKQILQERLVRLNNQAYGETDPSNLMATRAQLIDDFGKKVADFATNYGDFYQRAGGLQPFQMDSIIRLLDIGPEQGSFESGTYQNDLVQQARQESRTDAVRRATELGLPTANDRDRYGRLLSDVAGQYYEDNSDTSLANSNINQRVYGAPKQLAYEYAQIVKGNKKEGVRSLYEIQSEYYDRLEPLYAQAKGLKGQAAQDIYRQISDIQEEYMTKEFDTRIKPLVDKYGPEALMNNKQIFEEISSRIMVPGDFTPFTSRKKQPYQKDDVEAYLLDRYGVGNINQRNLPTDTQVADIIRRVNADLDRGRSSAASYKLDNLQNDINAGRVYVDPGAMNQIRDLISLANKR